MARTRTRWLAAFVSLGLILAACGNGDDTTADDTTTTVADDGTDDGATVAVTAVDFEFQGLPASVAAGTTFTLSNDSDAELHEIVAARIPDDEERSVAELLQLPEEELFGLLGPGLRLVMLAPPGAPSGFVAVGDGTLSEPGRYAIICAIPTGADPDEYLAAAQESEGPPQVEGGPPHFVHGMFAELIVE